MRAKFKVYDSLKDTVTGFEGTVTCILFNGHRFMYKLETGCDDRQNFKASDFNEERLELVNTSKRAIGFRL